MSILVLNRSQQTNFFHLNSLFGIKEYFTTENKSQLIKWIIAGGHVAHLHGRPIFIYKWIAFRSTQPHTANIWLTDGSHYYLFGLFLHDYPCFCFHCLSKMYLSAHQLIISLWLRTSEQWIASGQRSQQFTIIYMIPGKEQAHCFPYDGLWHGRSSYIARLSCWV